MADTTIGKVVTVSRSQVAAARLRVKSDQARGKTPDPRFVKIAEAKPIRRKGPVAAD
jgi:hypothetical protein